MKKGVRGQFQISFGIIFSIILIVAFIIVAFIVIQHFLELKDCTQVAQFYDSLKSDVDGVWKSQESSQEFKASLPSGITYVCFAQADLPAHGVNQEIQDVFSSLKRNVVVGNNVFLYPAKNSCGISSQQIKHLDLQNITVNKNPFCIRADGNVHFRLEKGFYDSLVQIGA